MISIFVCGKEISSLYQLYKKRDRDRADPISHRSQNSW